MLMIVGLMQGKEAEGWNKLQEFADRIPESALCESILSISSIDVASSSMDAVDGREGLMVPGDALFRKNEERWSEGRDAFHRGKSKQIPELRNDRSNAMKRFCIVLALTLPAIPIAGVAQAAPATQTTPAPAATTTPVAPAGQAPAAAGAKVNYSGPVDPARYVIGPEDQLQITVWKEPTLSGTIPVRPDGMISMGLVGDITAAGMTPTALSTDISQRLKKYIQDPVVTVVVLGVNSQRVFLVGEVGKVGPVVMTPGMTPLQAIVTGGGLTQFA